MFEHKAPPLEIGDKKAEIPIVQGGMGVGISGARLATAVADAGGIGVISAVGIGFEEPDFFTDFDEANRRALRKKLRKARQGTNGLLGVNIMVALTDYDAMVDIAIEEKMDFLFLGAGLPIKFPEKFNREKFRNCDTKFVPIVSSAKAAELIFKVWAKKFDHIPDAVVVEGPRAGGHLGFKSEQIFDPGYSLEKILKSVVESLKSFEKEFGKEVPVIAAGGIYTGADIHRMFLLGAKGVQLGTRFVATHECDADEKFKQAYLQARKEDIRIIRSPVGLPGRAIYNKFLADVEDGYKHPVNCPCKCLRTCDYNTAPYCIALALTQAKKGLFKSGFAFAGDNVWRVNEIISVKELIYTLLQEYEKEDIEVMAG